MIEMSLLHLDNVSKTFNKNKVSELSILDKCSFELIEGEHLVISGESGSGKTTILNILGLLDKDFEGRYQIQGQNVGKYTSEQLARLRNDMFGIVFQEYVLLENATTYENIMIPLYYSKKYKRKERRKRIQEIAKTLKIENILNEKVSYLSGGQRQRVAIGRALINDPKILLMDEPTSSLNQDLAQEIMNFIVELGETSTKTIILVTHDMKNIPTTFKRNYKLKDHKLYDQPVM